MTLTLDVAETRFLMTYTFNPEEFGGLKPSGPWAVLAPDALEECIRFFTAPLREYFGTESPGVCVWQRQPAPGRFLVEKEEKESMQFSTEIVDLRLYLFRTGIAMLSVECNLLPAKEAQYTSDEPLTIDALSEFNYQVARSIADRGARFRVDNGDASSAPAKESLAELARGWLPGGVVLDSNGERSYRVQTYARDAQLDPPLPWVRCPEKVVRFARVTALGYAPTERDKRGLEEGTLTEVLGRFDTERTGITLEGMAILAAGNSPHVRGEDFRKNVRSAWAVHYVLALHQREALLQLAVKAGKLDSSGLAGKEWSDLRREVSEFNLRHRYSQVSGVTNYRDLYEHTTKALRIGDLLAEVRDEVHELDEQLRRETEKGEKGRAEKLNVLILCFGLVGLLFAVFGTNLYPFGGANDQGGAFYRSIAFLGPFLLVVALSGVGYRWLKRQK